jgi:hypothetical protein
MVGQLATEHSKQAVGMSDRAADGHRVGAGGDVELGGDLISDALPFGRLWYEDASAAVDYAKHSSRSHDPVIRVYDDAGNLIETHEHAADFKEP